MNQPSNIETQIPPHNLELEAITIGCVLLQGEQTEHWQEASLMLAQLRDVVFYDLRHKSIFWMLKRMGEKKLPLSMLVFAAEVDRGLDAGEPGHPRWREYGGSLYVSQLPDKPASGLQFESVLEELYELAERRVVVAAGAHANDTTLPLRLPQRLERPRATQARHVKEILPKVLEQWQDSFERKGQMSGIPSGLADLDRLTSGWQKQNLIIIGARPSQGKTAMLCGFAVHAALENRIPTAFFSVESSSVEIVKRCACMVSRTDQVRWRNGTATEEDYQHLAAASVRITKSPLYVIDCPGATIAQISTKARELKATYGIHLICVDYLQKIRPDSREEKRTYEVAQVSQGLKQIASELDVPLITAGQLNREIEKNKPQGKSQSKGRMPGLADLADSSQIERDADMVCLLHVSDSEHSLLIAKFRDGPLGVIKLSYLPHCARFENATKIDRRDYQE